MKLHQEFHTVSIASQTQHLAGSGCCEMVPDETPDVSNSVSTVTNLLVS